MKWIRDRIAAIRSALSADALPERVFWRFVFANFILITLSLSLAYYAESKTPIWAVLGAVMSAGSMWLLPVWLFRVRGVSWLRATISMFLAATLIISMSVAAFDTATNPARPTDNVDPGTGAYIALSALAVMLFRALWQPIVERKTVFSRVVSGATAAALYAVVALWAGTALHPMFQMALNGPLGKLNPARIADAERYLDLAASVVSAIPIQPIVIFLALAVLTVGVKTFGRSFQVGVRIGLALTYASLAMLGLTSYTYIVEVAAPVSLERLTTQEGTRLAGYRDRHSALIASSVAVNYLSANPHAVLNTRHVIADARRGCREYNYTNAVESEVEDTKYRHYDDAIGEDFQWFNIGTETINCDHREYYSAYVRAIRGSLRITGEWLDDQGVVEQADELTKMLDDIDRLSATTETRPGDLETLIRHSQEADIALRAAETVIESKLSDLATAIIGDENANWLKPVLREFITTLMTESAKEGFASSVQTLTAAEEFGQHLAEMNSAREVGFLTGRTPYQPPEAIDKVAGAAREFAVSAKISITSIRIEEGGDWRTVRNMSKADLTFLKIACVFRPTSCRHVF